MRRTGVTLELARLTPRPETPDSWNRVFRLNEKFVDELCSKDVLLGARKFALFEKGKGRELCSFLDSHICLDEDLQFLRLCADCDYSWKAIENLCKVAYRSESLYKWMSEEQWLRTVSEAHPRRANQLLFRSNVVPVQAYLRVAVENGVCAKQGCTEGFFRIDEGDPRSRQCRGKCDLSERLKRPGDCSRSAAEGEARSANELLPSLEELPDIVRTLSGGSDGTVSIVSYRRGLFARKEFPRKRGHANPYFVNEREVAKKVRHPNIVHCFSSTEAYAYGQVHYSCLTMELLQDDLEGVLLDLARKEDCFSFRDSVLVLLQIAEAMKHLHDRSFVHGDLKAGNIFVSRLAMPHSVVDNRFYLIKVGDFGRTQRVDSSDALQSFGFEIGTCHYNAPEVFRFRKQRPQPAPEPSELKKMDVYSFGVVAYQVLTGLPSTDLGKKKKPGLFDQLMHRASTRTVKFSIEAVMKPDGDQAQWRPSCVSDGDPTGDRLLLLPLVKECWSSSPQNRPDFSSICERIQTLFDERFPST